MFDLKELLSYIELPTSVASNIISKSTYIQEHVPFQLLHELTIKDTWQSAYQEIMQQLPEDLDGLYMLTCMLMSACESYEMYQQLQIDNKIYVDTMKCFTRFVKEYQHYAEADGFDRAFWCGRQLSLQLFRIGALEYECLEREHKKVIDIHIPSDTRLSKANVQASIHEAHTWFKKYFPEYQDVSYTCESWLLSPALSNILPPTSRILQFQALFQIQSWNKENDSFMKWIFSCKPCETQDLPSTTTLQREVKQWILDGNFIGSAYGVLNK